MLNEPKLFTRAGDKRFAPYALPLNEDEQERSSYLYNWLRVVYVCVTCMPLTDRPKICPRCILLNHRRML